MEKHGEREREKKKRIRRGEKWIRKKRNEENEWMRLLFILMFLPVFLLLSPLFFLSILFFLVILYSLSFSHSLTSISSFFSSSETRYIGFIGSQKITELISSNETYLSLYSLYLKGREKREEREKEEKGQREERATGKFMKTDSERTNKVENIVLQTEKRKCWKKNTFEWKEESVWSGREKEREKKERFVKIELKRTEERTTPGTLSFLRINYNQVLFSFYENCSSLFALFSPFSSRSSPFYFHFFFRFFLCSCHLSELLVLVYVIPSVKLLIFFGLILTLSLFLLISFSFPSFFFSFFALSRFLLFWK